MIEITFLGTGCMQPTKTRNHSGVLLKYKAEGILMDCGEGIQRQMKIAGIKLNTITKILISHWHGDHVFGIPGLMSSMGADKPDKRLKIYGPPGTKKYMENMFKSFAVKDIIEHEVYEIKSGVFFENEDYQLEAQNLNHSVRCIGFSFKEKSRRRIKVAVANKLGLEGPILGELQQGKNVTHNGKKVKYKDLTYEVEGKKVSYVADTVPCEGAEVLAKDCDLLISEGTHLDEIKEKTEKYMHLTVKQAALIASENNAKKLVITHISRRYKEPSEVLEEAKTYFDNVKVAEDFMTVRVE
jgi:ribonuclease Z